MGVRRVISGTGNYCASLHSTLCMYNTVYLNILHNVECEHVRCQHVLLQDKESFKSVGLFSSLLGGQRPVAVDG